MWLVAAFALVGCSAHPRFASPVSQMARQTLKEGTWRLVVETGKFSGDTRCHLADARHGIVYSSGALSFSFGRSVNTLGGWVRIDNAPAQRWRDYLPTLYRLDAPVNRYGLENTTDGKVWIPAEALDHAGQLAIQPSEHRRPVIYTLSGFAKLRETGRGLGCTPDARFLP